MNNVAIYSNIINNVAIYSNIISNVAIYSNIDDTECIYLSIHLSIYLIGCSIFHKSNGASC